ncbi:hypothetical protein TNCV_1948411 [Trichonephila clavipes]|nr:hypothetical protein TNCV_3078371 [Trichonephila clavipes]GFW21218.1 hypothetical protein TNCV_1948411 [Trichonephila clavipes]
MVSAQVSSSSLDNGSKLRGPSPKALEKLKSAPLIFSHSIILIYVTLSDSTCAIVDESRNLEPWSRDEDDICTSTTLQTFTPTRRI